MPTYETGTTKRALVSLSNPNPVPISVSLMELVAGTDRTAITKGSAGPFSVPAKGQSPEYPLDVLMPSLPGQYPETLFIDFEGLTAQYNIPDSIITFTPGAPTGDLLYDSNPKEAGTAVALKARINNTNPSPEILFGVLVSIGGQSKTLDTLSLLPGQQDIDLGSLNMPPSQNLNGWPVQLSWTWGIQKFNKAFASIIGYVVSPPIVTAKADPGPIKAGAAVPLTYTVVNPNPYYDVTLSNVQALINGSSTPLPSVTVSKGTQKTLTASPLLPTFSEYQKVFTVSLKYDWNRAAGIIAPAGATSGFILLPPVPTILASKVTITNVVVWKESSYPLGRPYSSGIGYGELFHCAADVKNNSLSSPFNGEFVASIAVRRAGTWQTVGLDPGVTRRYESQIVIWDNDPNMTYSFTAEVWDPGFVNLIASQVATFTYTKV